ncbi:16741_t:CDS:2, partial [Acaulospora morrowiae]
LTLQDCGQQYPDIGTKLDDFRTSREELENRRKALQEELEEVERKLINNSTKMQEVEYERGRVEGIENQRALLLQNRKNADEVLKTLMDKVDKSTKPNQEETVKSSSKSVDKNANGKRNVPTEIMSPETLLKKTKLSSSVPSEEMDQLRQRLENVSREHQEIRQNIVTLSTRKVGATPNPSDYTTTTLAEMDPVPEGISAHSVGKIHIVDGGDTVDENVYAVTSATTDHLSETSTSNINNNAAINNSTSRAYEKHTPVVWSDSDDNLASEADEDPFESYRSIRLCKNSKQKSHSLTYSNKIHPDR